MEGPLLSKIGDILDIRVDERNSLSIADQILYQDSVEWIDPSTNACCWYPIEIVLTLVQIIPSIIIVLIQPKDEEHHPQTLMFIWIIGYTCACIANLPILSWHFWYYTRSVVISESTEEYSTETRINEVMDILKCVLECFFVAWFVVFIWNSIANSSSIDGTTNQVYWLCMALVTFSFIRYVFINIGCAVICYLSPGILCVVAVGEVVRFLMKLIGRLLACVC